MRSGDKYGEMHGMYISHDTKRQPTEHEKELSLMQIEASTSREKFFILWVETSTKTSLKAQNVPDFVFVLCSWSLLYKTE